MRAVCANSLFRSFFGCACSSVCVSELPESRAEPFPTIVLVALNAEPFLYLLGESVLVELAEVIRFAPFRVLPVKFWPFDLRILFDTVKTILFGSESVEVDGGPVAATVAKVSTGRPLGVAK